MDRRFDFAITYDRDLAIEALRPMSRSLSSLRAREATGPMLSDWDDKQHRRPHR
jgi:hypothetical protein